MSHVDVEVRYNLNLNGREFRLVSLALAGKLPDKERRDALELNVQLCEQRTKFMAEQSEVVHGAYTKAKDLLTEDGH